MHQDVLLLDVLVLVFAALPAISPVADQKLETECINLHTGLETNAQVLEVHLVLVRMSQQKTEMTGDGKEEIILEWREVGKFVNQKLRNLVRASAFA